MTMLSKLPGTSDWLGLLGMGKKSSTPAPVAAPAAPAAAPVPMAGTTTTKAVADQAAPAPGRAANIAAGQEDSLSDSNDPYSVKKKLLGY